jgi:peptidoglycan/xylan/chitin deacetylase (PgdA/CDA1 family)
MNHSWSHPDNPHLRPGDPRKFRDISRAEVEEEIERAHDAARERLGVTMRGFRVPHFDPHPATTEVLARLGYRYTTNELSLRGARLGAPYVGAHGLVEIPLSGVPRCPDRVVETYRLFRNPDGFYPTEARFLADFEEMLALTESQRLVTTMYFDADDIRRLSRPSFASYLERIGGRDVDVLTFGEVADIVAGGGVRP